MPLHPYPLSFVVADFLSPHISFFYAVIKYESVPLHPYPLSFVVADFLSPHISFFYAVIKYESVPLHPYPLSVLAADFLYKKRAALSEPPSLIVVIISLFLKAPEVPAHTVRNLPQI